MAAPKTALPSHLKPANGSEPAAERHHGKSQSHVVSRRSFLPLSSALLHQVIPRRRATAIGTPLNVPSESAIVLGVDALIEALRGVSEKVGSMIWGSLALHCW